MAIAVADGFQYFGAKPLDSRIKYETTAAMKSVPDANLYEGCIAYCVATDKYYKWLSSNTVDETLGKWREYQSGGGSSYTAGDGINIDENNEISTDNLQEGDIADCLYPLPSPEPGVSSLGGLTDVVLTSPEEGNAFIYDEALQKWVNGQGGKVYTAGDGISIDANDEISTDNMQSGDMDDVFDTFPGITSPYPKYSTSEQIVAEWIDGKYVYERVIVLDSVVSIPVDTWTILCPFAYDVDTFINCIIINDAKHVFSGYDAQVYNNELNIKTAVVINAKKIIARYTKTTV